MKFVLSSLLVYVLATGFADSGYIITTPRKWTIGAGSQICASLERGTFTAEDSVRYKLREDPLSEGSQGSFYQGLSDLKFPVGSSFGCVNIPVPPTKETDVTLWVTGTLNSQSVNETVKLTFVEEAQRTFISTDKYLYRPGQKVQFRILSVGGPKIAISTESYEEVIVVNPSEIRIAQWNNVDNSAGLVHLSFDLYEEIPEGYYRIEVRFKDKTEQQYFEVQNFVLPRYEVVIDHPKGVLGSSETVTINVCARYTFGEPVRGEATVYLASLQYDVVTNISQSKQIDGCQSFTFSGKDLYLEYNNCHIRLYYLSATAVIVEDGTGVTMYAEDGYIPVQRRAIEFTDRSIQSVPKPFLPVMKEIRAAHANGTAAANELMEVCFYQENENRCKNFTTDSNGDLKFIIPFNFSSSSIEVKALNYPRVERIRNSVMEASTFLVFDSDDREYYDTTYASLTIMRRMLQCTSGEDLSFRIPVVYVTKEGSPVEINVQIQSRGQVLATNKMRINLSGNDLLIKEEYQLVPIEPLQKDVIRGSFEIPITISDQSSPKITVLVWYVKEDGVVVADAADVEVSECLSHKVSFDWSSARVEPGKDATLMIKGASKSLCSIGVVDKSVDILSDGKNNYLHVGTLLNVVYDSETNKFEKDQKTLDYCLKKYGASLINAYEKSEANSKSDNQNRKSFVQALHVFNDAGYAIMTNLDVARKFCMDLIMLAKKNLEGQGSFFIVDEFGFFQAPDGELGIGQQTTTESPVEELDEEKQDEEERNVVTQARSYVPETWLWLLQPLSDLGELNEAMVLPDTITEWVGNAVCVHPIEGVGISNTSSITTFSPFFVDLTLPSAAKRGEIFPIVISIFNYLADDLPVRLTVIEGPDFEFVEGETGVRELCIKSTFKAVETVRVNLTRIGNINITIEASSQPLSKGYCGSGSSPKRIQRFNRGLPVDPEGYSRERTFNEYICTQDIEDLSKPVSSWQIEVPEGAVVGSERAWITAVGDLIGPTLQNLENLVNLPYNGNGEQNMIYFAPNVYILKYLDASSQTTPSIREKIVGFLAQGYQREQMFRHQDGSYSAYQESSLGGSTWLTAFVVKSFAQAIEYTTIDIASLAQSTNWLRNLQEPDGCFVSRGYIYYSYIQGGLEIVGDSPRLLTAYVLAALLEMEDIDFGEERKEAAIRCLEAGTSNHPYSLALRSYSLALAKAESTKAVIDQLLALSVSNSTNLRWIVDGEGRYSGLNVEIAAYALLALLTYDKENYQDETRKIARWISGQRNAIGGFYSTQDTVVALQALAAFEKVRETAAMNMDITVSCSALRHSFKITNENRLLQQRIDIPTLPNTVDINVDGVGCALVQGVLRYNVLNDSIGDAFKLDVDVEHVLDEGCDGNTRNITVCTSYTLSDGASNMAIIEFQLVTGYVASETDLAEIVGEGTGTFRRFETEGTRATLFLDKITSEQICISVRAFPEIRIGSPRNGTISVYDYYQPEYISTRVLDLSFPKCPSK